MTVPPTRRIPRLAVLACLGLAALSGCKSEEIRSYEVPREKHRLLGAIAPTRDATWFFKLMGRSDFTERNAKDFWAFVRSVRFQDNVADPVTWTVPDGWTYEEGTDLRHATFRLPLAQVVTVSRLGGINDQDEGQQVLSNVNRWRRQLKLPAINGAQLMKQHKTEQINEQTFILIDLESARTDAVPDDAKDAPPTPPDEQPDGKPNAAPPGAPITYTAPSDWSNGPVKPLRLGSFYAEDKKVEISVIALGGDAGGLRGNVNRWREEVGLPDVSEAEVQALPRIDMGGIQAVYLDAAGKGGKWDRTIGAIAQRGDKSWYVKMWGPGEAVGRQKANFEALVRSIRFAGGN